MTGTHRTALITSCLCPSSRVSDSNVKRMVTNLSVHRFTRRRRLQWCVTIYCGGVGIFNGGGFLTEPHYNEPKCTSCATPSTDLDLTVTDPSAFRRWVVITFRSSEGFALSYRKDAGCGKFAVSSYHECSVRLCRMWRPERGSVL